MNNTDEQMGAILTRYGVPLAGNVWQVEGQVFIRHKALEQIAAHAEITFDAPTILRSERDEAVLLVVGRMGERAEWSFGEALVGVNYLVSEPEAAYVYAMAEKRAKDRVILKLIDLQDVVSSEEPYAVESRPSGSNENTPAAEFGLEPGIVAELKRKLDAAKTVEAIITLMTDAETQRSLADLTPEWRDEVRNFAKRRMGAFGWVPRKAA